MNHHSVRKNNDIPKIAGGPLRIRTGCPCFYILANTEAEELLRCLLVCSEHISWRTDFHNSGHSKCIV